MRDSPLYDPRRVVVLAGPTGSGKTALTRTLCAKLPFELVCMDSMQLYREMRIGTCRPTDEELTVAPHHFFGTFSVKAPMTAVRYAKLAAHCLGDIQSRGNIPLLVGGTGLYMRSLFDGTAPLPTTPPALRRRLDRIAAQRGRPWLYRLLQRLDPEGAAHLHPNDKQRIQRFLEVRLQSGTGMLTHWRRQKPDSGQKPTAIGLQVPRPILRQRIESRLETMLKEGWIAETKQLEDENLIADVLQCGPIGYREILDYLHGKSKQAYMYERIAVATKRYAKRQMTWFRKVDYIQWFPFDAKSGYNETAILDCIIAGLG